MAADADTCGVLSNEIYSSVNPQLQTDLLTPWVAEHEKSQTKFGFTSSPSVIGYGSTRAATGLVPVARLYNAKTSDFVWAVGDKDVADKTSRGFVVQSSANFYAAPSAASCTVPVHRFTKSGNYAVAETAAERTSLAAAGWADEGAIFHLKKSGTTPPPPVTQPPAPEPPASNNETFSIAVMPDTQVETNWSNDPRMNNRAQWLVNNKAQLNLAYVMHVGDVVNWGAHEQSQYVVARNSFDILDKANIPYSIAIGNHDAMAVGHDGVAGSRKYGGSAYVNNPECKEKLGAKCNTTLLQRETQVFNKYFSPSSLKNVGGTFEPGKSDNMWTTFKADGANWLVVTLEFHARKEAIAWAGNVVASHPNHNVIVLTHSYLNGDGSINFSNSGYGATTGKYLFDNLIGKYPNVKMAFSGHVGNATVRKDTGVNGNTILSFLNCFHDQKGNPVRMLTIDADSGKVTSKIEVPNGKSSWNSTTYNIIDFIK
ncbi:MAG: metallophosphoesterase [Ancrocorticia sp.]